MIAPGDTFVIAGHKCYVHIVNEDVCALCTCDTFSLLHAGAVMQVLSSALRSRDVALIKSDGIGVSEYTVLIGYVQIDVLNALLNGGAK